MSVVITDPCLPSYIEERALKARQERDASEEAHVHSALPTLKERFRNERRKLFLVPTGIA